MPWHWNLVSRASNVTPLDGSPEPSGPQAGPGPRATPTDGELVERALEGDAWAEEAIYRRHVHEIGNLTHRLLGDPAEAQDVVQDAFALAFERLGKLRQPEALRSWLKRIAFRQINRRYRRRRLQRTLGVGRTGDPSMLEELAREDAPQEVRVQLGQLDRVLTRLPAEMRLCWILRHVQGESLEDIAALCGRSLATVKRRIAGAEERMRKLDRRWRPEP